MSLSFCLANPIIISNDLEDSKSKILLENSDLDIRLQQALIQQGITTLFPVQEAVMRYHQTWRDICVCAPTGSGKTLAYLLPPLQSLHSRRVVRLRALIMVPGRELATQVLSILEPLAQAVDLKVGIALGQTSITSESRRLVNSSTGASLIDILVATPGRLLDHLENTKGFTLQHLQFLILDEADRLLEGFTQDWLPSILSSINETDPDDTGTLTFRTIDTSPFDNSRYWLTPLRKILSSATLTRNPAMLVELKLQDPIYISATDRLEEQSAKYSTARELEEFLYVCEEERKPVPLIYLLQNCPGPSLCFTKSVEATERLTILLSRACPSRKIMAFSADHSPAERSNILACFSAGSIDLLVCTDAAARGLDLPSVAAVINYDAPKHLKTYIHRVGRTARAGKPGKAYTVLAIREAHHFKEMLGKVGKGKVATLRIPKSSMQTIVPLLESAIIQ